jgi:hypothetical protein
MPGYCHRIPKLGATNNSRSFGTEKAGPYEKPETRDGYSGNDLLDGD